jgi:hypothetical protein
LQSTLGTPLEEREGREITMMKMIANIKKVRKNAQNSMRGKNANLDRSSRRYRDEGCGRKIKGSARKGAKIFKDNKHPSTNRIDDDHFGTKEIISWRLKICRINRISSNNAYDHYKKKH